MSAEKPNKPESAPEVEKKVITLFGKSFTFPEQSTEFIKPATLSTRDYEKALGYLGGLFTFLNEEYNQGIDKDAFYSDPAEFIKRHDIFDGIHTLEEIANSNGILIEEKDLAPDALAEALYNRLVPKGKIPEVVYGEYMNVPAHSEDYKNDLIDYDAEPPMIYWDFENDTAHRILYDYTQGCYITTPIKPEGKGSRRLHPPAPVKEAALLAKKKSAPNPLPATNPLVPYDVGETYEVTKEKTLISYGKVPVTTHTFKVGARLVIDQVDGKKVTLRAQGGKGKALWFAIFPDSHLQLVQTTTQQSNIPAKRTVSQIYTKILYSKRELQNLTIPYDFSILWATFLDHYGKPNAGVVNKLTRFPAKTTKQFDALNGTDAKIGDPIIELKKQIKRRMHGTTVNSGISEMLVINCRTGKTDTYQRKEKP
jgi:hypothetical protein